MSEFLDYYVVCLSRGCGRKIRGIICTGIEAARASLCLERMTQWMNESLN